MWVWLTLWGLTGTGLGIFMGGGAVAAVGSAAVCLLIGLLTAFCVLVARTPITQRDEARALVAKLQETSGFPDVEIRAGEPLEVETVDSGLYAGHRETIIAISIRATNRERERRAILEFTAYLQTEDPRPGVWTLSTLKDTREGLIPNPMKLEPQDFREGELLVSWGHDMDFMLFRDLRHAEVIARESAVSNDDADPLLSTSVQQGVRSGMLHFAALREGVAIGDAGRSA